MIALIACIKRLSTLIGWWLYSIPCPSGIVLIRKIEGPRTHIEPVQIHVLRGPVIELHSFNTDAAQKQLIKTLYRVYLCVSTLYKTAEPV
jgi:hypothetical protein